MELREFNFVNSFIYSLLKCIIIVCAWYVEEDMCHSMNMEKDPCHSMQVEEDPCHNMHVEEDTCQYACGGRPVL